MRLETGAIIALTCLSLWPENLGASTYTLEVNIGFDSPLVVSKEDDINFGVLKALQAGVYTISPTGTVTASGGGVWIGGTVKPGSLTIYGSETQEIDISVGNYVAHNGATPSDATCMYDGGSPGTCSLTSQPPPGTGKNLSLGIKITVDGTQDVGTLALPTFDVIVTGH